MLRESTQKVPDPSELLKMSLSGHFLKIKPTAATYLCELYLRGTSSYKVQRDRAGRGTGVF